METKLSNCHSSVGDANAGTAPWTIVTMVKRFGNAGVQDESGDLKPVAHLLISKIT
jgi:hypothetical protein